MNNLGYAFRQERAIWIWRYIALLTIGLYVRYSFARWWAGYKKGA